jgi:hypothetical protein
VDFEVSVVVDVAQLPKLIHKVANAEARRTDHVRERLLADFGDDRLALSVLAEVRQQDRARANRFSLKLNSWSMRRTRTGSRVRNSGT